MSPVALGEEADEEMLRTSAASIYDSKRDADRALREAVDRSDLVQRLRRQSVAGGSQDLL